MKLIHCDSWVSSVNDMKTKDVICLSIPRSFKKELTQTPDESSATPQDAPMSRPRSPS